MNTDIRLKCNFVNHIKTKKLIKKLGYEGFYSLISLWCYTAQNKPKGTLDMTIEDIAIASNWSGDAELFVSALLQCGFLEKTDGGILALHDWAEHNRYAYYAEERSRFAKEMASRRWSKKLGVNTPSDANGIADSNADSNAFSNAKGNAPSPIPIPSPSPIPIPSPSPIPIPSPEEDTKEMCLTHSEGAICTQSETDFVPSKSNGKISFDSKTGTFLIPEVILEKYKQAYPAINLANEIRKMEAWVLSQPKSRWKKDWRRFISGWLSREQDKAEFASARNNSRKGGFLDD